MQFNNAVFDRSGGNDEVSEHTFYAALTACLLWGLLGTAFVAYQAVQMHHQPNTAEIWILGLCVPLLGGFIAIKSDNPIISFFGYNLMVIPYGIILGPLLQHYSPDSVKNALLMTGAITFFMGFMGTCFPSLFQNLGGPLFIALLGLLAVRIIQMFVPELQNLRFVDYISAGIFSLYIGYDMYRASSVAKTLDNAVDIAVDLYLDIVNIFLSLLDKGEGSTSSSSD